MSEKTQSYKGARDFYPEDKRFQKWMFGRLRSVVERFGYEEYDAPVLESTDLYRMKGSDEIISTQSYTFDDRGGRSVTMRTEMTPSVSRMIAAKRQEIAYPARWYSIPNLWRYERPQRGRLREFWQLNVDIFGVAGIEADFEIIQVADAIMKSFGATEDMYEIRLNSRALLDAVLNQQGMDEIDKKLFLKVSDKWEKFSNDDDRLAFINTCLDESGYGEDKKIAFVEKITDREIFEKAFASESADNLKKLIVMLGNCGIAAKYDPYLARGFAYYSDIVFEVFDTNPDNNRSMFGGGRYDGLVGLFGVEPVPTVGFGMGDATLENFIRDHGLEPELLPETLLYIVLADDVFESLQPVLEELREEGVKVAVDTTGRKVGKQIEIASKKGIPYVMVVGKDEIDSGQFKLKELATGIEETHSISRIITTILAK